MQGSGGGGSTNVRFDAATQPDIIAGGGGGGSRKAAGGDACPADLEGGFGGTGASSKALDYPGVGGGGGIGGRDQTYPNQLRGGDGYGGPGGHGMGASNGGWGEGSGKGGNGDDGDDGSSYYLEGSPGGGGGYGGGANGFAVYITPGAGAGGSLWPGMTPTTPNAPVCVPAGNGGADRQAGGHGSLTITWNDDQLITCAAVSKTFGDPPFAVPAATVTVPEGIPPGALSYHDASGACQFDGDGNLELIAPGTCTYRVRAAGGSGLNPAEQTCSLTVAAPPVFYPITAEASPAIGGSVSCSPDSVEAGESSTCIATPSAGYHFTGWGGDCTGSTPACTLDNITASRNVTAYFESNAPIENGPGTTHPITATASPSNGGSVSCTPDSVEPGRSSTCTALPSAGYRFIGWGGHCSGSHPTCTLGDVTASRSVTAYFAASDTPVLTLPEGPQRGQPLTLAADEGGWTVASAATATTASLGAPLPAGVILPHGVVSLRLTDGAPGSHARVVLIYPAPLPPGTRYYKYGPTADEPQAHWYAFAGARIDGNVITLTLEDGGAGDSDGRADGTITDPGGPALPASAATAVPTLSQWALLLLAGLMGVAARLRLCRRGTC